MLEYAVEKERREVDAESRKKEGAARAMRDYADYLAEQMKREAEDTAWADDMRR